MVIIIGPIRDALFAGVLIFNTLIGVFQELRAKRTLDRLSLLSAPRAMVIREGSAVEISRDEVVLDDLLELTAGDQVLVDGEVLELRGAGGGRIPAHRRIGPHLEEARRRAPLGELRLRGFRPIRATAVGEDAYAQKLASEAKRYTLVRSDLRDAINTILRYITYVMIPVAILLVDQPAHSGQHL